jgi:hypothetical protein
MIPPRDATTCPVSTFQTRRESLLSFKAAR